LARPEPEIGLVFDIDARIGPLALLVCHYASATSIEVPRASDGPAQGWQECFRSIRGVFGASGSVKPATARA
jgi:hypothetical protein